MQILGRLTDLFNLGGFVRGAKAAVVAVDVRVAPIAIGAVELSLGGGKAWSRHFVLIYFWQSAHNKLHVPQVVQLVLQPHFGHEIV